MNFDEPGKRTESSLGAYLVSDAEFRSQIEEELRGQSRLEYAMRLTVKNRRDVSEIASYFVGEPPQSDPYYSRTILGDDSAVDCRCEIWRVSTDARQEDLDELVSLSRSMVAQHWGNRDPHTLLPYLKTSGLPAQFVATSRRFATSPIAVLHTDLDNFKKINSEFGEKIGDAVLAEFAKRFRLSFEKLGVTVRTGGDEFSAILDFSDPITIIKAAEAFRHSLQVDPFEAIGRTNTCSVGLSLYETGAAFTKAPNQDSILADARDAETRAKSDGRNRICLVGQLPIGGSNSPSIKLDDLRTTALMARRINPTPSKEIVSAFKVAVRSRLRDEISNCESIVEAVGRVRSGLGLLVGSYYVLPPGRSAALLGVFDSLDWAGMVASALFEAAYSGATVLKPTDTVWLVARDDGALALDISGNFLPLDCAVQSAGELRAAMGRPFYPAGSELANAIERLPLVAENSGFDLNSPVLLLPIGDEAKVIAEQLTHLVAAIVDVDDRPARSGGLPDFWQSNVSRVIRAALTNPNIVTILAIGDETYVPFTMERLRSGNNVNLDEWQRRLSMTKDDLNAFHNRIPTIARVAANSSEVLKAIEAATTNLTSHPLSRRPIIDQLDKSRRRIPIPPPNRTHRLDVMDGLKTKTLADAYPEALQLIRSAQSDDDQKEFSGGLFREVTGFKVILTEPLSERIPDYWAADSAGFEKYYVDSFKDKSGPFGKRLLCGWNAESPSLNDIARARTVDAATSRIPTRRINIPIIPDTLDHPLGLSSIQVMPRTHNGIATLDIIFVWRTVDALVGFPFSAFGSIRWAEDLLNDVNGKLQSDGVEWRLKMGYLTYIALSFHLYLHEGDVEIARAIVQSASL